MSNDVKINVGFITSGEKEMVEAPEKVKRASRELANEQAKAAAAQRRQQE